jgi:hypothetical protein
MGVTPFEKRFPGKHLNVKETPGNLEGVSPFHIDILMLSFKFSLITILPF